MVNGYEEQSVKTACSHCITKLVIMTASSDKALVLYNKSSAVAEMPAQCCATWWVKRWGKTRWEVCVCGHESYNAKKVETFGYIFVTHTMARALISLT